MIRETANTITIDEHLGRRLRSRRRALDLTLQQVAEAVGTRFQQIHKYESGATKISGARLWELAKALDVPVNYFFDGLSSELLRIDLAA